MRVEGMGGGKLISSDTLVGHVLFPISPVIYPSTSAVSESHHYKTKHHYHDGKNKSDQLHPSHHPADCLVYHLVYLPQCLLIH